MRPFIRRLIILKYIFFPTTLYSAASVFIIVHGTWGANSAWYMPGGDFFDTLEQTVCTKNSAVVPFCWSGGCGHKSRVKAAHNLVKLIGAYDKDVAIYLVAHSHGGNVCMLASHILAQDVRNNYRIRGLFTLGTPVMSNYIPNMDVILYLYNLFSFEDLIQPVFGVSGREYPDHNRIANIRVFINDKEPGHGDLHDLLIARVIPMLHRSFKRYLRQKNVLNTIAEPSILYCHHAKDVEFVHDAARTELRKKDQRLLVAMVNALKYEVRDLYVEENGDDKFNFCSSIMCNG